MANYYRDVNIYPETGSKQWITELRSFLLDVAGPAWVESDWSSKSYGTSAVASYGIVAMASNTFGAGDYFTITDLQGVDWNFVPSTSTATPGNAVAFEVGASISDTVANLTEVLEAHRFVGRHFNMLGIIPGGGGGSVKLTARVPGDFTHAYTLAETGTNFSVTAFAHGVDDGENPYMMFVKTSGANPVCLLLAASGAYSYFGYTNEAAFLSAIGHFVILAVAPDNTNSNGWDGKSPHYSALSQIDYQTQNASLLGISSYGQVRITANEDRLMLLINTFENSNKAQTYGYETVYAGDVTPSDSDDLKHCTVLKSMSPVMGMSVPSSISSPEGRAAYIEQNYNFPTVMQKASPAWTGISGPEVVGAYDQSGTVYSQHILSRCPAFGQKVPYSLHTSIKANKVDATILVDSYQRQEAFKLIGVGIGTTGVAFGHTVSISGVTHMFWPTTPFQSHQGDTLAVAIGTAI